MSVLKDVLSMSRSAAAEKSQKILRWFNNNMQPIAVPVAVGGGGGGGEEQVSRRVACAMTLPSYAIYFF